MRYIGAGKPKDFAFVEFATIEEARAWVEGTDKPKPTVCGKEVRLEYQDSQKPITSDWVCNHVSPFRSAAQLRPPCCLHIPVFCLPDRVCSVSEYPSLQTAGLFFSRRHGMLYWFHTRLQCRKDNFSRRVDCFSCGMAREESCVTISRVCLKKRDLNLIRKTL